MRAVTDYRLLKKIIKPNNTAVPRSDEMFHIVGGTQLFSKIDLKTGFHQIHVKPEDIRKTALSTKYGRYEFFVLRMGLFNDPATFLALMNEFMHGYIDNFCIVYLNDILIFSQTAEEHCEHRRPVLDRLCQYTLYASPRKSYFMTQEVELLGFIVNTKVLNVNPIKVEIIRDWPRQKSVSDIRSFLGLASFIRCFIQVFSVQARPMTELKKKVRNITEWFKVCEKSMDILKQSLISAKFLYTLSSKGLFEDTSMPLNSTLAEPTRKLLMEKSALSLIFLES